VHDRSGAPVDEDELGTEDVAFPLHVRSHWNHAPSSERVVHLFLALDDAVALMRREHDRAGHDQRLLIFLADLLPVLDVGEYALVRFEVFFVFDLCGGRRGAAALTAGRLVGDFHQRQHVSVDDAQLRLGSQLTAEQPRGLQIRVDVVGAAGDEAGDEDALKRRHIQLRTDRRLDRDLVIVGARRRQQDECGTTERPCESCGH
jgi:hypothetical protein